MKPRNTLKNAKVIKRIGKWTVESYDNINGKTSLLVTDGWLTHSFIIYSTGGIAFDNPEAIPQSIKNYLNQHKKKLLALQGNWDMRTH